MKLFDSLKAPDTRESWMTFCQQVVETYVEDYRTTLEELLQNTDAYSNKPLEKSFSVLEKKRKELRITDEALQAIQKEVQKMIAPVIQTLVTDEQKSKEREAKEITIQHLECTTRCHAILEKLTQQSNREYNFNDPSDIADFLTDG